MSTVSKRFTKKQMQAALHEQLLGYEQIGVPVGGSAEMLERWVSEIIDLEVKHVTHLPVESKGEMALGLDCCGDRTQVLTRVCCPHCRGCFCVSCYKNHCVEIVELLCGAPLNAETKKQPAAEPEPSITFTPYEQGTIRALVKAGLEARSRNEPVMVPLGDMVSIAIKLGLDLQRRT